LIKAIYETDGHLSLILDGSDWVINGAWQAIVDRVNKTITVDIPNGMTRPYSREVIHENLSANYDNYTEMMCKIRQMGIDKHIKTIKVYG